MLSALVLPLTATGAAAQFDNDDVLRNCGLYSIVLSTGGDTLIAAANELALADSPAPPGIAAALDTIIEAEENEDVGDEAIAALDTLNDYYGGVCLSVDQCPLVEAIEGDDRELAASAAAHLRDLNRPNPPGIGIALQGLIDPETDPDDYARFRAQVLGWFTGACDQPTDDGADDGDSGDSDGGDDAAPMDEDEPRNTESGNSTGSAADSGGSSLPNTGFGTFGMFLILGAFVAFTVGGVFMVAADR